MRVVLGVSGGIAAYKACSLLRLFTEHGHDVTVVPTAAALQFVGAPTWSALSGKPVSTDSMATIADGIGVRIPVPDALTAMRATVDEVMLVSDEEILEAMRMLFVETGLVVEPAGAAGLAAVAKRRGELAGQRVATPLCGGNLTEDQIRRWLTSAGEVALPRLRRGDPEGTATE